MNRSGWAIGIVIALVLILLVGGGLFASGTWGRGYGWGMMGPGMTLAPALRSGASAGVDGWGGVPFMGPIFCLVLAGLIIGGVVWFARSWPGDPPGAGSGRAAPETPLEILKRRYASGEITKKQYEEMRRTLDK